MKTIGCYLYTKPQHLLPRLDILDAVTARAYFNEIVVFQASAVTVKA